MDGNIGQVLVINCGSSSIKYQLLAMEQGDVVAGGLLERIGEASPRLKHHGTRAATGEPLELDLAVAAADHGAAFRHIAAALRQSAGFDAGARLLAVGHRVVHGGEAFAAPTLIDDSVIESIRALSALAPLHNPPNLVGIEVCREHFGRVPQVAVFDTAFHQAMPPHAYRYAVPKDWYEREGVRRYGFHGSSHRYVATRAAAHLVRPLADLRLITLHLGNGASAAAIAGGRGIDTSMGFTPLEGLVMGTRSGDLDPAAALYMQQALGLEAGAIERLLNRESGLKGLCGSNDMRDLLHAAAEGSEDARLALDVYCYRIRKYVGAYAAALGGVDGLVFTGGVGENAAEVRRRVCRGLEFLGIAVDATANEARVDQVLDIGQAGLPVQVLAVRTNEELQIAREALEAIRR
jgi:acetate kinase